MKRSAIVAAWLAMLIAAAPAQQIVDNTHCGSAHRNAPLRQTVVVVDGAIVTKDTEAGPAVENAEWRRFVSNFVNAANPLIGQLLDARERVTIAIANADASGLTPLFTGCVPLVSEQEARVLDAGTTTIDTFFGRDWRSNNEKAAAAFARSARLSTVRGAAGAVVGRPASRQAFAQGALVASLRNSPGFDLSEGLVRYVMLSDLTLYDMQATDAASARRQGFRDAESVGLRLGRSEVHFFANGAGGNPSIAHYLDAFFLGGEAKLETFGGASSTLSSNRIPVQVAVYQGTADFPNIGQVPVRMRLALDRNNGVVLSWIQEQRRFARSIPLEGVMNCPSAGECVYSGGDVFAQVWSFKAGPDPQCESEMPWGGMRNLDFRQKGDTIEGKVSDTLCVIRDREDIGIPFLLRRLDRGEW